MERPIGARKVADSDANSRIVNLVVAVTTLVGAIGTFNANW
jgi:hypothetical protein